MSDSIFRQAWNDLDLPPDWFDYRQCLAQWRNAGQPDPARFISEWFRSKVSR